jgi:hypothetical protein
MNLIVRLGAGGLCLIPLAQLSAQDEAGKLTIGGYGEVHYTNFTGPNTPGSVNVKRFVIYAGYAFNDRITLHSELELEDTKIEGGESGGEVALEQAYLDYRFSNAFTLRTGLLLPPIGIINEIHEPPSFNGVERPDFDNDVIPTTWRDIGVGALGQIPGVNGLSYRVFLVNGLKAEGFTAAEGIREGRQEGKEASFANPSFTGRIEYAQAGLKVGGSFWYGGTANQAPGLGTGAFDAPVLVLMGDARYDNGPFMLRAVGGTIEVYDADKINAVYGQGVGRRIAGGYVEGGYNLLAFVAPKSSQRLNAFVRYDHYDTQAEVAAGTLDDATLARRITTFGLTYKPLWNVAFKADYQFRDNQAGAGENEVLALGVGYQF